MARGNVSFLLSMFGWHMHSKHYIILYTMLSWLYYAFFFHIFFISENLNLQIKYIEKKQKLINKSLHIFKHNT